MDISVIVVSYNTAKLTKDTLDAIQLSFKDTPNLKYELIVVDNASTDSSPTMLKDYKVTAASGSLKTIFSKKNVGFGAGNNLGIKKAKGKYILLLNSDVIADKVDFTNLMEYMDTNTNVGGLTVRVELPNGKIDPASHRGFPTVWRSFTYFTKLQALTSRIPGLRKTFGGYHLTHLDLNTTHEIDSPTAAFYLIRADILHKLKGFDEDFFMYGEDLDLSMRIKQQGYDIIYYPKYTVTHLKHQSGLKTKKKKTQSVTTFHFYNAMKIFYDKHYGKKNIKLVNWCVHKAIDVKYLIARS